MEWKAVILAVLPLLWLGVTYNRLVKARNMMREAWSGIDVQLKRRHTLIPNLVTTVTAYAGHEQELLTDLARARGEPLHGLSAAEASKLENAVSSSLKGLIGLVEAYPDLKADKNFRALQDDLVDIEDHLQYARRYYNGTVRDLNTRIESFPSNVIAGILGFRCQPFFEVDRAVEREAPRVDLGSDEA